MFSFGDPANESEYFTSKLAGDMEELMRITHERQRASAFAGPVGIGKSRAGRHFKEAFPDEVALINVTSESMRVTEVLYLVAQAVRLQAGERPLGRSSGKSSLQVAIHDGRQQWWTLRSLAQPRGGHSHRDVRQTLIFDEAQNLHPRAISALRFLNDRDNLGLSPLGLIFVGNAEFSLTASDDGSSPLSLAVADRMLFREQYTYAHVTDDDIRRYIEGYRVVEAGAINLIIKNLKTLLPRLSDGSSQRSYRNVDRLLDRMQAVAGGGPLNEEAYRRAFEAELVNT